MNEEILHLNERNLDDRIAKKNLKELSVHMTYTNNVHLPFRWFNLRNSMVKHALLGAIHFMLGDLLEFS